MSGPHSARFARRARPARTARPRAARAGWIAVLAAVAALAMACESTPPAPSSSAAASVPTPGPTGPAPSTLGATFDPAATLPPPVLEGLYVTDQLSVSGDATVAVLRSGLACAALEHLLGAGEWSVASRQAATFGAGADATSIAILALRRGDETALAFLTGGDACTARVARTTTTPLEVAGTVTFDGPAALDEGLCVTQGKLVALSVTYRAAGGPTVQVGLSVPARLGLARLDPDEVTLTVSPRTTSLAQLATEVAAAFRGADDPAGRGAYVATDDSRLTLDVTSLNPFAGTLHLGDFEGDDGAVSVTAQVACHLPGGALDRAAAAAAGPTASGVPGGSQPPVATVAPPPGVAAGSIVVTGSAAPGTYQLPASQLDCFYDVDAGAWTIETLGSANPIFYLYAFTGPGGGATDQASMGLIVGDGSNGRMLLLDTSVSPPVGTARVSVAPSGSQLTVAIEARSPEGGTLAANLSCPVT